MDCAVHLDSKIATGITCISFIFFTLIGLVTNTALASSVTLGGTSTYATRMINQLERDESSYDGSANLVHPFAFTTGIPYNETYTLKEILQQDDKADFVAAMKKEIKAHEPRDHWTLMRR